MHAPPSETPRTRTLSVHRAFVIRLYHDADLATGAIGGLLEHVVSGAGGEFTSIDDLLRLMRQVLDGERLTNEPQQE